MSLSRKPAEGKRRKDADTDLPEGFIAPNPPARDGKRSHPNDSGTDADPPADPQPTPDVPATAPGSTPDDAPDPKAAKKAARQAKKAQRAAEREAARAAKQAAKASKKQAGKDEADADAPDPEPAAPEGTAPEAPSFTPVGPATTASPEAPDASTGPTDTDATDDTTPPTEDEAAPSTLSVVKGHRFGLRLGTHKAGNLLGKLKARLNKEQDPVEEQEKLEEEEAVSDRIEPDDRYKEVETYPIHPPYAYVRILFDDERKEYIYQVLEPVLTKTEQEILDFVEDTLVDNLTVSPEELEGADELEFITDRFNDVIFDYSIILHEDEEAEEAIKKKLLYYLRRNFIGQGPVDVLMSDPYIEDVSCDGPHVPIFLYHRKYESMRSTVIFGKHEKLDAYVIKMAQRAGKHISIAEPILDATMADGSRLQSTLGTEVSAGGSTFTIRKFRPDPFTPPDLVLFRTMSAEMLAYLWIAVQHAASIMYAGGTASGKTTSLNAILLFIPPNNKIVSIEDTREVNLPHENWIAGITRSGFGPRDQYGRQAGEIDMFQLLKNALRQRPEYIIVGEVRGQEAYSLFQAMATGHAAYGTMHADSVDAVIHRLESDPINIPRSLLEALDIVSVQVQTRVDGKRVRRTKQISEIVGLDPHTREILTNEVFRWVPKDDSFRFSGVSYILERIQLEKGMASGSMVKELQRRAEIIEWMIGVHIQDYQDVSRVVSAYYREPEVLLDVVRGNLSLDEAPPGLRRLMQRADEKPDDDPLSASALASGKVSDGADPGRDPSAEMPDEDATAPGPGQPAGEAAPGEAPRQATAAMEHPAPAAEHPASTDAPAHPTPAPEHPAPKDAPADQTGPSEAPEASDAEPPEGEDADAWLKGMEERIRARYERLEQERKRIEATKGSTGAGATAEDGDDDA